MRLHGGNPAELLRGLLGAIPEGHHQGVPPAEDDPCRPYLIEGERVGEEKAGIGGEGITYGLDVKDETFRPVGREAGIAGTELQLLQEALGPEGFLGEKDPAAAAQADVGPGSEVR